MKIVKYKESLGEYTLPEGFREQLDGLSIEEQLEYFRVSAVSTVEKTGWGTQTQKSAYKRLSEEKRVTGIIVDGEIVVGAMIKDFLGYESSCFFNKRILVYSASDNNGAGYTEVEDYLYLVAIPKNSEN